MTSFPRITRPCPYKDRLSEVMDGDFCRMCNKTVTDLSAMNAAERAAFLRACAGEEACVSYRVPVRALLGAAAAVSMSMTALAAAADTPAPAEPAPAAQAASSPPAQARATTTSPTTTETYATEVGGFAIVEVSTRHDPRRFPEPLEMRSAGIPTDDSAG